MAKKRKSGTGTLRKRKDGRWEGRVVIGYDDNGLPKTKNVLGKTRTECLDMLLAAYSTADLTDSGLDVLSIYGSEDGVLNMEKYESNRGNLPENTVEVMIPGGNHAGFGCYGPQNGDGEAGISATEQIQYTAEVITAFVQ